MEHVSLIVGRLTYVVALVRSRLAWVSPLYWRTQYHRVVRHARACQQWDHQQYERTVNEYEARLAKEQINRECAVRCYEAMLADREKQLAIMAAQLRTLCSQLDEFRARESLPVHTTEQQSDLMQLDLAN